MKWNALFTSLLCEWRNCGIHSSSMVNGEFYAEIGANKMAHSQLE